MAEDKYESEELRRLREQVEEARRLRSIMLAQHIKSRSIADIVGELLREHRPGGIITGWENPVIAAAQRFANQTFQHAAEWGEMTKLQQELTRLGGPPSVKPSPTPSKPQPIKPKPTPPPAKKKRGGGRGYSGTPELRREKIQAYLDYLRMPGAAKKRAIEVVDFEWRTIEGWPEWKEVVGE